jgi:two-component system, OmpR family, sensor histidine kinase VanS
LDKTNKDLTGRTLSGIVFERFFVTLVIFSTALAVVFYSVKYILSGFIWQGTEFLYPFVHFINLNSVLFLIFCWLAGLIIIFIAFWKRTLGYVDTITDASNALASPEEDIIHLPVELKLVEDRMNQVKRNAIGNARLAKEAEQRKNDLIVYLAHDLKTPLTSVIGYLTLLRDERQISEGTREKYLSITLEKAERLEDLINEFFEITRFNLSQLTLETSRVDLARMLEQIIYEFKPLFTAKNLTCSLRIDPGFEMICDVDKMERVFDNLIRNAINYSFENTVIEITVIKKQDNIYMRFGNSGNTIPKDKLKRIFEQFYRLDTSRSARTGGAGLGLAIAKEIVELHKGTITASSENERIEFRICLPYVP